ncbi:MAG: hypothetical protein F6K63_34620 [Moorea sp. SIO1G6]|uniref:hypothetical protein n=1 Tax=Moorena sp. SIO1G6 TaxID=2607840 RepID=UPI0013C11327|nr:hypothetical protein [Moorena sp. SIO1G6]NES80872.1 hypothetical protein [Moorena sp. SIO2B7]NET69254.1 hypothetical protein [Moorena sp. SIO1G6]
MAHIFTPPYSKTIPVGYDNVLNLPFDPYRIHIPHSPEHVLGTKWLDWLNDNNRFRYIVRWGVWFSAWKTDHGYWTAQRVFNGRHRSEYLGESQHLTWSLLRLAAVNISFPDEVYWFDKSHSRNLKSSPGGRGAASVTLQLLDEYLVTRGFNGLPQTTEWEGLADFRNWVAQSVADMSEVS